MGFKIYTIKSFLSAPSFMACILRTYAVYCVLCFIYGLDFGLINKTGMTNLRCSKNDNGTRRRIILYVRVKTFVPFKYAPGCRPCLSRTKTITNGQNVVQNKRRVFLSPLPVSSLRSFFAFSSNFFFRRPFGVSDRYENF